MIQNLKRNLKACLAIGAVASLIGGCAHNVIIKSEPDGASVFEVDPSGNKGTFVGTTPLNISPSLDKNYYAVEIKKDGFEAKHVVVPLLNAQTTMGVKLQAYDQAWLKERFKKEQARVLSTMFLDLLKLQNAILTKRDKDIIELTAKMDIEFEDVSVYHSMLGNYNFFSGKKADASKRYEKALKLDPTNEEAKQMLNLISRSVGN